MEAAEQEIDVSYEPFSRSAEYVAANRGLVDSLADRGRVEADVIVDLACGTGTLTDLVLQRCQPGRRVRVVGVDLSAESLALARAHLAPRWPDVDLVLLQGDATRLDLPDASADLVTMGNAIHLIDDKPAQVQEVRRVLRPGGRFGINSSFYAGTFPEGTEGLYLDWVKEALSIARSKAGPARRAGPRAFSTPWQTPHQYADLIAAGGLRVLDCDEVEVRLTAQNLADVGAYSGLATVLLPGYDGRIASESLVRAASVVFERAGLSSVPRRWMHVVADVP